MTNTNEACNMCGRIIGSCDDFYIRYQYGYGSCHDGDYLILDLCTECLDKTTQYLIENCKISPV